MEKEQLEKLNRDRIKFKSRSKSKFGFKTMKSKLMITIILVTMIPVLLLGLITSISAGKTLEKELINSSTEMGLVVGGRVDEIVSGIGSQIDLLSNSVNFKEFYLNDMNDDYGMYLLEGTLNSKENYRNVFFASNKKDMLLTPEQDLPSDYDPTIRDWYKNAIDNKGNLVINEPYTDAVTGDITVTLSKTVENNGEIIGVVGVDLDLNDLSSHLADIKIGDNGYIVLLSSDGTTISHYDKNEVGNKSVTELGIWDSIKENKIGNEKYKLNGVEKITSFSSNELTGWIVLAVVDESEITSKVSDIQKLSWIIMAIAGIASILVSIIISNIFTKNINIIRDSLSIASTGDFTVRANINSNDEFKELEESFNSMMDSLSEALDKVEKSSKTVLETSSMLSAMTDETSSSVSQVAEAITEVAEGTSLQSNNTQNAVEEILELSNKLNEVSMITEEMSDVSNRSSEFSSEGLNKVEILTIKSSQTRESTDEVGNVVTEVSNKMIDINKMVENIKKFANDTDLLSLNASIEAAHAGEAGKGFAVVASAIKKLAEQSRNSADDITNIVENIQSVVNKAVLAMDRAKSSVGEQEIALEETRVIFNSLLESVNSLQSEVSNVKVAVLDITANKENVVSEMESISAVSQQTAASSEEVSASAEEISATMEEFNKFADGLQALSKDLDSELSKFKLSK